MPQPPEILGLADELRAFASSGWAKVQADIDDLYRYWPSEARNARAKRLADLQAVIGNLREGVEELSAELSTKGLHTAYTAGAALLQATTFTAIDVDALGHLAQDFYDDVLEATRFVDATTKTFVRELARKHIGDAITTGQPAKQAARDLRQSLEGRGIAAITYKNGARHGLADYTDMLSRTKLAQAYNAGTLIQSSQAGIAYLEVFDGFGCGWEGHGDVDTANGTIRSLAECERVVLSHPRCQRSFGPRPDLTSARDAENATSTQDAATIEDASTGASPSARLADRERRLANRARRLAEMDGDGE